MSAPSPHRSPPRRCHRFRERGSVLIITMWVCLGLLSVTLLFGHSALMSYRASGNDVASHQADVAIEGALRYAEYVLSQTTVVGAFPDPNEYQREAFAIGDASVWFLGRAEDTLNGSTRVYGLVDEASKLNLNTATEAMLELLPGMTPDFANTIVQWRSTSNGGGISSSDVKAGPFESEGELALLPGADPLILAGEDANFNGVLDEDENDGAKNPPEDNSDGKLTPGIFEYVTAFSREPSTRADGSARFKVSGRITQDTLTAITTAYPSVSLGTAAAGLAYTSPLDFYVRTGMTAADFDQIAGDLTTGKYQGLVNVNTAHEYVLRCLPGMDDTKAAALVAARTARTPGDGSLSWVKDVLDEDTITQVGPMLTGRSYQVTADIAAVGRNGRGYRRTRFVIDLSTGTPRVIYRRNLASLGWALGRDARQTVANLPAR